MVLVLIFAIGRMERCAFRYNHEEVINQLNSLGDGLAVYNHDPGIANKLHYFQVGGDTTKPYVVFVHGSPGSMWDYRDYLLSGRLRTIANLISVDRQGFGYSQFGRAEGSLISHADQLAEVIGASCANSKVLLVGHSLGGPVVSKAIMEYPELANGMILIAPSISPADEPPNGWRKLINFPVFRWLIPPALNACNQEIIPLKRELQQMVGGWSKIRQPVTVIQGTADRLVPMQNALFAEKMLVDNRYFKKIMLEDANHFILWSEVDLIVSEIANMIEIVHNLSGK